MDFMQIVSFILMFGSFALIGKMILSFRKARGVSTRGALIAIGMSLVFIWIYWTIIGTNLPVVVLYFIILLGAGLGIWRGQNTRVWIEEDKVMAQNTVWFLMIWAFCYGFNQFLVSLGASMSLNIGIGTMCLGTGVVVGSQGNMLYRLLKMPTSTPPQEKVAEIPTTVDAPKIRYCRKCGSPATLDDRFCKNCGSALVS